MKHVRIILLIGLMTACVSETTREAESRLGEAKGWIQSGDMEKGIRMLDSIAAWYPTEYRVVNQAMNLKKEAATVYHQTFIAQAQAMLEELEPRVAELSRHFNLVPGAPGRPGMYEHKRQRVPNSWSRSYLKVNVLEDGQFWLTSHYYGQEWLDHTSIKVYDRELYAFSDTLPLGHPDNHKLEDGSDKWETIEFKDGSDNGVVAFIVTHADLRLKVRFTGKRHHYIVMETFDKEAVRQGYELAQVLQDISELRQKIERRERELRLLGHAGDSLNQSNL